MRDKIRVGDWCSGRTVDFLWHEDKDDDQYDRYGDSNDGVYFRIGWTSASQAPYNAEYDCNYYDKCSYTNTEDSTWTILAICAC